MRYSDHRLVFMNCVVWTADGSRASSNSIALSGSVVHTVGRAASNLSADWPRVSLEGYAVLPGLIDSHVHLSTAARSRLRLSLEQCSSLAELLQAVRRWADTHQDDTWIVGTGWDDSSWDGRTVPSRTLLDGVVPDRPVYLVRRDRHSAVLNSRALERLDIPDAASQDLAPRDEAGEFSGIVRETLLDQLSCQLPPLSLDRTLRALDEEQHHLWSLGVVGVHSMERQSGLELLGEFKGRNRLGLRLYVALEGLTGDACASCQETMQPQGMKWYADGSLGSDTAWLYMPGDEPTSGVALTHGETLRGCVEEAVKRGLDPCVHAIGDRAVHEVLDTYEPFLAQNPSRLFRIEHVQHITREDLSRLGHKNLVLSVQPCHLLSDREKVSMMPRNPRRLDYAYQSMLRHGATLVMGTDLPIEPADPWRNMAAAMSRCEKGGSPWHVDESMDWLQVLKAYTYLPALAAGWSQTGQLTPGFDADLVIVHQDPGAGIPWDQRVALTMRWGRIVYSDGSIRFPCEWPTW